MSRKLAIEHHLIRPNEVIELLEMMGGKNIREHKYDGSANMYGYYIINGIILNDRLSIIEDDDFIIFTLEEFLEKYPFKVGDKVVDCYGNPVTIKSMKWSDDFETMVYDFEETEDVLCAEDIESMNDIHTKSSKMKNVLAELLEHIKTTPKEELEREFEEIEEWSNVGPTVEEFRTFCECVNKKPKYPTTYAKCCEVLVGRKPNPNEISFDKMELCLVDLDNTQNIDFQNPYLSQLNILFRLRMSRDAYWKIAGEEMGLDGPWEPNYNDSTPKYTIVVIGNDLIKHYALTQNFILAFPTEKMRDAFYENFKDLIEQCKELL